MQNKKVSFDDLEPLNTSLESLITKSKDIRHLSPDTVPMRNVGGKSRIKEETSQFDIWGR